MKIGVAGTLESNDAMVTVKDAKELKIVVNSIVYDFFGEQIEKVIRDTLEKLNIRNIEVECNDKGALDYTIKARLITAIQRMREVNA